jgi:DNA-binding transcriptional LysR family regulator
MLLEHVEGFLAIAQRGNLSKAAEAMYVHQPTLTARLASLEHELGEQLFVRTSRGMRLSEAGRAFLPHAQRALRALRDGQQAVTDVRLASAGRLVLGAAPAVSTYALPDVLQRFTVEHPRVEIAVRTGHSEDVLDMVLREDVQLGMMRAIAHRDLESWPFYEEDLVLVAAPGHPFANKRGVRTADLADQHIVLFDRTSSWYELTHSLFLRAGVTPRGLMELDNIEAAKSMVQRRLGIAFLPRTAVKRDLASRELRVVKLSDAPRLSHSIVIVRRRDAGPPVGPAAAFLDLVRQTG